MKKTLFLNTIVMVMLIALAGCQDFSIGSQKMPEADELAGLSEGTTSFNAEKIEALVKEDGNGLNQYAVLPLEASFNLMEDAIFDTRSIFKNKKPSSDSRSVSVNSNVIIEIKDQIIGVKAKEADENGCDGNYATINTLKFEFIADAGVGSVVLGGEDILSVIEGTGNLSLRVLADISFSNYIGEYCTIKDGQFQFAVNLELGMENCSYNFVKTQALFDKYFPKNKEGMALEEVEDEVTTGRDIRAFLNELQEINGVTVKGLGVNYELKYAYTVEVVDEKSSEKLGYKIIADSSMEKISVPEIVKITDNDIFNSIIDEKGEYTADFKKLLEAYDNAIDEKSGDAALSALAKHISENIIAKNVFGKADKKWCHFGYKLFDGSNNELKHVNYDGLDGIFSFLMDVAPRR